jgi:hypothetical protein
LISSEFVILEPIQNSTLLLQPFFKIHELEANLKPQTLCWPSWIFEWHENHLLCNKTPR